MEVIWDKNHATGGFFKREFKWGAVLMGNTDGVVVKRSLSVRDAASMQQQAQAQQRRRDFLLGRNS